MVIRDPLPRDEADWRRLWTGYTTFYEADVPEDVTAETWRRLIARDTSVFGRVACEKDLVIGFSNSVLHPGTWTKDPICYLEDLFVDPAVRGKGVGRALIDDLIAQARSKGWSKLYWVTRQSNATARRLYDTFVQADDFVRYLVDIE
jgi:GNAT superfamily N-acetyltransferase